MISVNRIYQIAQKLQWKCKVLAFYKTFWFILAQCNQVTTKWRENKVKAASTAKSAQVGPTQLKELHHRRRQSQKK